MDHLQACVEFSFAVFPESSTLFQPGEGPLDHPPPGHDGKGMQIVSLRDLHGRAKLLLDRLGERPARVAAVHEYACGLLKVVRATVERSQRALAVGHFGRRDGHRMRQALGVDRDMALDAGDFLARVIAFFAGGVGVLYALRVNDQEAGRGAASLSGAVLAN